MGDREIFRMAKELDGMRKPVSSDEAEILERVLSAYRGNRKISSGDSEEVRKMHDKYLAPREEESEASEEEDELDEDLSD